MRMKPVLFAFWNLMLLQQAYANTDLIIKPDKLFIIAQPDDSLPAEKTATEELAKYISQATCAKTEIIPEGKLKNRNAADAYVGKCRFTEEQDFYNKRLRQEEFNIAVKDGKLFIYGDDGKGDPYAQDNRTGTLFGIYDFLENELGIAWIWPGKSGEDVPAVKELRLQPFSRTGNPMFYNRSMMFSWLQYEPQSVKDDIKYWMKRMKMSAVRKMWFNHSWDTYVFKQNEDVRHPEWLALWGGERKKPHCCISNSEFRDYIVQQCLNNSRNKDCSVVSISPSDGYGFCECEKCRALDPAGTDYSTGIPNLSDRHWAYANYVAREVKKRNPELNVGMYAYTAYREPPANMEKLEDNLIVSITFSVAYFVKPEEKEKYCKLIDNWKSKGVKIAGREYWGMHYWLDLPYIFTKQIKDSMPYLHKCGFNTMNGEVQKNFATQGPNYYLVAHMMWNPEIDADRVLSRYYKAFGPAGNHIRKYYDTFEDSILENQNKINAFAYLELINSWPEIFPEKTLSRAGECIQNAKEAVKGNPVYEERVNLVETGYLYTKNMLELLDVYRKLGRGGVPLWCFGYQGALAEFKYWKTLPEMPATWVDFWKKHPDEPLGKEEKMELLKRALLLGNERERLLKKYAELPALPLGNYQYSISTGIRNWHLTIRQELEKEGVITE